MVLLNNVAFIGFDFGNGQAASLRADRHFAPCHDVAVGDDPRLERPLRYGRDNHRHHRRSFCGADIPGLPNDEQSQGRKGRREKSYKVVVHSFHHDRLGRHQMNAAPS